MISISALIQNYSLRDHPYTRGIFEDEIIDLVSGLRNRFKLTNSESDFSPKSLIPLEKKMQELYRSLKEGLIVYTDEDYLLMIRQISAYFIQVLRINRSGILNKNAPSLFYTQVTIFKSTTAQKGGDIVTLPKIIITVGISVASAWDIMEKGKKPTLYKDFQLTTAKIIREDL